jgi:agmatine deiminase
MPAEWAPHAATWIAWPHNRNDWPGKFQPIPWVYAEIVRNLAPHEGVHILVNDAAMQQGVRRTLEVANAKLDSVVFHHWPTNRVWTRDYGPIFVRHHSGDVALVHFGFNAWAKYDDWQLDARIPSRIAKQIGCRAFRASVDSARPFVLEGGSIDVNGNGTLLTTEECLLSDVQQRNPGLSREGIERALHDYLGVTNVLWLGNGIIGDDTHGHVDDIARFVRPDTVLMATERDKNDPNHAPLAHNLRRMRTMRDERGRQISVVELPMPRPLIFRKYRVPASYANFYIANGVVLAPVFNDPNDRIALNTLAEVFPDREIVPVYCGDLIWGFGAIHCMTQQQPKG